VAAESDRAYSGGPIEGYYYQQSSFTPLEAGPDGLDITELLAGAKVEGQYPNHLDWFTVDLEGEKSAMDGWILEQHANYVVGAVHRVFHFTASAIYCAKEHALRVCVFSVLVFTDTFLPSVNRSVVAG
jgi:glycosylphosphatidylinositol deacylase